ncbi:MAG TPA: GNAT family N-acetyltransferase [Bacteroidales bacterium]|nr:GNAT family N-acetyltransferase [Bacteroidales bacterium]HRX96130.1 GNAT family N-acetyltransferase [Bacteroidales bacterium]
MEIRKFRLDDKKMMKLSNEIRKTVFIDEQHVDPEIEYEYEKEGNYYLLFVDDKAVATARWRETAKGIKLERFALLKEYRNKGVGTVLLKEVLNDVKPLLKPVYLHSQVRAVNYYKRVGFKEEGAHFWEAEIEHVKMVFD